MGLQMLVNAILLGGLYALMGIGFSLQWGISGIINLSYGAMVMLGSYISLEFFNLFHIDPFISMIMSGAILFVLGAIIYRGLLQPFLKGGIVFTLILTFAVRLIMESRNTNLPNLSFYDEDKNRERNTGSCLRQRRCYGSRD